MPKKTKVIILNAGIVAGLIWCYFTGYPPKIILMTGVFLLAFANASMYFKHRKLFKVAHHRKSLLAGGFRAGYSNSEQDMKYPQRGQIILHFWDSSRLEQTGQN